MALNVINKVNSRLKFLYRQNEYLTNSLRRMLCNAIIQPFFYFACSSWYPTLNINLSKRLQCAQNKCIRFCLRLGFRESVTTAHFRKINWLPVKDRFSQTLMTTIYNVINSNGPDYMSELFCLAYQNGPCTRFSYKKLILPRRKTNSGLRALSYLVPSKWNKIPNSIKNSKSLNSFKQAKSV